MFVSMFAPSMLSKNLAKVLFRCSYELPGSDSTGRRGHCQELLISRGKRQDPALVRQYLEVHQSSELELKSLRVVLTHRENLPGIFSKIRARTQKPSQGRRKAKARREETTTDVSLPSAERAQIG